MCSFKLWKDPDCEHTWLTLDLPCKPGKTLLNCKMFEDGALNPLWAMPKKIKIPPEGSCPSCDLNGEYDLNYVRMVESIKRGWGFGFPRGKRDELKERKERPSRVRVVDSAPMQVWCSVM